MRKWLYEKQKELAMEFRREATEANTKVIALQDTIEMLHNRMSETP